MTTDTGNGARAYGFEVPVAAFLRVADAEAPGRVFNQTIRGKSKKVEVMSAPSAIARTSPLRPLPRQRVHP